MARIEGIRIRNFRSLKDITLGKLWNLQSAEPLTPLTAVIGHNGSGKSSLFDAFGFLADCLTFGVEDACDRRQRGGFERIRSQGTNTPIEFVLYFKGNEPNPRPLTYELAIDRDESGRPFVLRERLRQRRKGQKHGWPFSFLMVDKGKGIVWKGDHSGQQIDESQEPFDTNELSKTIEESSETEPVDMVGDDVRKLGIAAYGSLKQHPRISAFRRFIEGWYLSYFTPDAARSLPLAGPQKHLNIHGDNIGNVVQFMEREHPKQFQKILDSISAKIPGISKVDTEKSSDGRLLLRFNDRGFQDPFYAQQMSDGTLKVFAYLLMLEDPTPPPFLCVEEPENGLYHKLLEMLVSEFRKHATGKKDNSQVFVTTHQPNFVDALTPEEVWVLEKQKDGFSRIKRASEFKYVIEMVEKGQPLGSLWYSDYLGDN
jgi:predicted ATPase